MRGWVGARKRVCVCACVRARVCVFVSLAHATMRLECPPMDLPLPTMQQSVELVQGACVRRGWVGGYVRVCVCVRRGWVGGYVCVCELVGAVAVCE